MTDIYVLNKNLENTGIIDSYKSLIWANRYNAVGDCELYAPAEAELLNILEIGNYLMRPDDDMICRIKKIELVTDAENGNYLTVSGYDSKSFLDQRIIWGTRSCCGNVEDFIRLLVDESLGEQASDARRFSKPNGQHLLRLGDKANFKETVWQQVSYKNIGEKVREYCSKYNWGYKVSLQNGALYFQLYKGSDRSSEVVFSESFENLVTTKYSEDDTNIGNTALIAGEGEGSKRTKSVAGYSEGADRYEVYVDARDVSRTITWRELRNIYPLKPAGVGSIQQRGSDWVYTADYIDIEIADTNQLTELERTYTTGTKRTADGNLYYRVYNADIAELSSNAPADGDSVALKDIVYSVYLLNRGYEKLSEYGRVVTFDGTVEPLSTFIYKQDYFLGDVVKVQNEYGISVSARIVEIVEVYDENGYKVEPKFEYLEVV